jgi:hypothetical protein
VVSLIQKQEFDFHTLRDRGRTTATDNPDGPISQEKLREPILASSAI